jgi:type IX secretion system PorP/SprF family membrane protein
LKIRLPHIGSLILALCFTLYGQYICAQDIHFSQFYEAPLLRNPALAGIFTGDYRVQGIIRDQWSTIADAYRTGSFSAEYKTPIGRTNDYFTTALQVVYDKAGTAALTTTEFLPALNYHKSLSSEKAMYLSVGFMGGLVEKTIDLSKVTTNSQYNGTAYDPALPNGETILTPNIHYWDGNLGISFNTTFGQDQLNTLYLGAALYHLNRPKNSFYQNPSVELDPKYVFCGGMKLTVNDFASFTIQADHSKQGSAQEDIGGVLYSYKLGDDPANSEYTFNLGGFLRWGDALIPVLKLDMNALSVSISYDVNISALKSASQSQGGFELSISYIGFLDRENSKGRILCPKF